MLSKSFPKLHLEKKICTEEVKSACAGVSAVCNSSDEKSRRALQTICNICISFLQLLLECFFKYFREVFYSRKLPNLNSF